MGYNTTVMICNDSLHAIESDPEFGKNLALAVGEMYRSNRPLDVPAYSYNSEGKAAGIYCNAASVIESHHADGTTLVAVGGNHGTKLGEFYYVGHHHTDDGQVALLKALADKLGYRVSKKTSGRVDI